MPFFKKRNSKNVSSSKKDAVRNSLATDMSARESNMARISSEVDDLITHYEKVIQRFSSEHNDLKARISHLETNKAKDEKLLAKIDEQAAEIDNFNKNVLALQKKIIQQNDARKKLHNKLLEIKGNIRVFCRVRPNFEKKVKAIKDVYDNDIDQQKVGVFCNDRMYDFKVDRVFNDKYKQKDIFDEVTWLIQSVLDGKRVCIFAYGQTGAGKTYTMEGSTLEPGDESRGIIPRSVEQVFAYVPELEQQGWEFDFKVSFLEIYNEMVKDLLVSKNINSEQDLELSQEKNQFSKKIEVIVKGLTSHKVENADDVYKLLQQSRKTRKVHGTKLNSESSRSHSVFQMILTGNNKITKKKICGVLNLIDLAGSERVKDSGVTGQQLTEAKAINKSLSTLSKVIDAVVKGEKFVPYRSSKLTHLLMNHLGNDSKTLMIVNVRPEQERAYESLSSLRFAQVVGEVQINKAKFD